MFEQCIKCISLTRTRFKSCLLTKKCVHLALTYTRYFTCALRTYRYTEKFSTNELKYNLHEHFHNFFLVSFSSTKDFSVMGVIVGALTAVLFLVVIVSVICFCKSKQSKILYFTRLCLLDMRNFSNSEVLVLIFYSYFERLKKFTIDWFYILVYDWIFLMKIIVWLNRKKNIILST